MTDTRRNDSRCFRAAIATIAVLALGSAGVAQTLPASVFEEKGFQENRRYLSELPFEHFDTLTGDVILTFTDLILPGNAGRDLRFARTYNSHGLPDQGRHWSFGLGGMVMRIEERPTTPPAGTFDQYTRDEMFSWAPILELADGQRIFTVFTQQPNENLPLTLDVVRSAQFFTYVRSSRTLLMPDGTVARYDAEGRLDDFSDRFGNTVDLVWGPGTLDVRQDLGNGEVRVVSIVLGGTTGLPSSMTYNGRTWTYECDGRPWTECSQLTLASLPIGPGWTYAYDLQLGKLNLVRTPQGGEVVYGWENVINDLLPGQDIPTQKIAITSRTTRPGRGVPEGTWRYGYSRWDRQPHVCGVTTPSGTLLQFVYSDVTTRSEVLAGGVGLSSRTVMAPAPGGGLAVIESEALAYHDEIPVIEHPAGDESRRWGVPQVRRRELRRDGRQYVTTYSYSASDFGDYHHPNLITETGETTGGAFRVRTTALTYRHTFPGAYITGLVERGTIGVDDEAFTTTREYDESGFPTTETRLGVTTTLSRDAFGNVATVTKANGKSTRYVYSYGSPARIETPEYTITREINADGTVRAETRAGRTTWFEYDLLSRLTATRPPGGTHPITIEYDDLDGLTITRRGDAAAMSVTTATADGFGRPIRTQNSVGVRTHVRYDAEGRTAYESYPFTGEFDGPEDIGTTIEYDRLGRPSRHANPDGTARAFTYGSGTLTVTDENGHATRQLLEAFGDPDETRIVSVVDARNQSWQYTYNGLGRLRSVVAPDGTTRSWVYAAGTDRLVSETHPESGTIRYDVYDAAGVLKQKTDAKGTRFTYEHDGNDRLVRETADLRVTTFAYEPGSDNRRLTRHGTTSTGFLYDPAGRISERQDTIDGRMFRTRFEYDGRDNLTAISYPTLHLTNVRRRVQFEHDSEGRITRIFEGGTTYASGFEYHPSGALTRYTAGNGLATVIAYDASRYWTRSIAVGALHLQYSSYDAVGNVASITDSRGGMNQSFGYDELDRLTSAASTGGYPALTYEYDAHGNRRTSGGTTYTYDEARLRLTGQGVSTFQHDSNGNLTVAPNATYTYSPRNMLESAAVVGGTTTYAYDADDSRVKKAAPGGTTYYLRGLDQQVLTDWLNPGPSGETRDYIFAGSRLIAAVKRSTSEDAADLYGTIVPGGPPVSVTFTTAGQRAWLSFDGPAGQRVSLIGTASHVTAASGGATLWNPLAIVRASDGATLTAGGLDTATKVFKDTVTLPQTGAYRVLIDPYGSSVGTATVRLFDVVDAVAAAVVDDPAVSLPLGTPGQKGRLTFDGSGGQRVSIVARGANLQSEVAPTGSALWYPLAIERPHGGTLQSQTYTSTDALVEPMALPDAGTYTILVDPYQATTGIGTISVHAVADYAGTIDIDGPAAAAALTAPGQKARFAFTGTAGQRVSVVGTATGVTALWGFPALWSPLAIVKPDGTTLAAVTTDGNALLEPVVLPVSGVYTVLVDPYSTSTGTATVQVYDVVDFTASLVVNGGAVAVPLSNPGQNGVLTFAGTAGDRVTVRLTGHTIGGTTVRLKRPDGTTLTSTSSSSTSFTLPQQTLGTTGIYTVLVDPIGARTGSISVAVTNP